MYYRLCLLTMVLSSAPQVHLRRRPKSLSCRTPEHPTPHTGPVLSLAFALDASPGACYPVRRGRSLTAARAPVLSANQPTTTRMRLLTLAAALLIAGPAAAQQELPVIRSNVPIIDVRNGDVSRLRWDLMPEAKPDVIPADLIDGRPHRVAVITDVDSISFMVEEGGHYELVVQKGETVNHIRIVGRRLVPSPGVVAGEITLAANPERVCYDERRLPYLNFDLIVRNGLERQVEVTEVRAFVLNARGEMMERRVAAQQTLALLGSSREVSAFREALLFNPFTFHSVRPDSRIRYEVHFAGKETGSVDHTIETETCRTRARLVLPLAGRIAVFSGHDILSHHRRSGYLGQWARNLGMTDNFQRFGLDLVVVDARGRAYNGEGTRNEDWLGWGQPVRAAGAGTVVAVRNEHPDNDLIGSENRWTQRSLAEDEMAPSGNYVLIDHGRGEFSLTSHLRSGSVRVRKGDRVNAGDVIAQVGNSGASLHPHVHYELRTGWGVRSIRALPAYFHDVTVIGTGEGGRRNRIRVNMGDVLLTR
jgi:hypothetical protein